MKKPLYAVIAGSLLLSLAVYAQDVQLGYNYEKGKTYRYRDILDVKSTQEMMGQEMKSDMHGANVVRMIAEDVTADGSMTIVASTDSSTMHIKAPGIDTTRTPLEIIGKKFRMNLARNGRVNDFKAVGSAGGEDTGGLQNQLGHFPRLSDGPVGIGSTWNASSLDTLAQKQFGGEIVTDTKETYTLVGTEKREGRDCYSISVSGNFSITGKGSMMGMDLHIEGSGKSKGTLYLDRTAGIIVASVSNVDMDMTVATTGQTQMVIPTSQSMTISRTLLP